MSKQPFMPLFFGDFLASTAEWTGEERSLYLTLLAHQWSLGSLPPDPDKVRRIVQWDAKLFSKCWSTVAEKFAEIDGRLFNRRLEDHRDKAAAIGDKRSTAGSKGAAKRWQTDGKCHSDANGKEGGFANGNTHGNENAIQSNPIQSKDSEGASKPRRVSRRCPEDFEPDRDFALAEVPDMDVDREVQKFRDWEFKTPRSDWRAAWRTWVRNGRDRGGYAKKVEAGAIQWQ